MPDTSMEAKTPAIFPSSENNITTNGRGPLTRLIEFDRQRPGIPGEHLMTAALGGWLMRSAARRRSMMGRVLSMAAGGLLLARAASGRDGVRRFMRR